MEHLDSGELRRMIDEPQAFDEAAREHAQTCDRCSRLAGEVLAGANNAARMFDDELRVDSARAYAHVRERIARRPSAWVLQPYLAACALAAVFVAALLLTPLGGYARSFLTIFEPQEFRAIPVSRADLRDLRLLPQADDVGTQRVVRKPKRLYYATIAAAGAHSPYKLLRPTVLPKNFGVVHSFFIISPGEMTYTFSARKARAFEQRSHKQLPPMPAGLDGTTVRLQTGSVFNAHYEATPAAVRTSKSDGSAFFELVEAPAPRVTSTGASLQTLERYLLALPNVSPELANQIRALGDIQNTVPVPVVINKQTARSVTVDGVQGLAIGDNTGLGAGVLWQKNGMIYALGGPLSMDQILSVANGLR